MKIIKKLVENFSDRGGKKPLLVVIHIAEGNLKQTYNWFKNPASGVSSHYGIEEDAVWQFVDERNVAWANGRVANPKSKLVKELAKYNPNVFSISIENSGVATKDISAKQYDTLSQLVAEICIRHNISIDREHIIGHNEIYSMKTCPGKIDIGRVVQLAEQRSYDLLNPNLKK
jgi:N-acetyl-anhydromuramyl-L-alanine amidase AmpD